MPDLTPDLVRSQSPNGTEPVAIRWVRLGFRAERDAHVASLLLAAFFAGWAERPGKTLGWYALNCLDQLARAAFACQKSPHAASLTELLGKERNRLLSAYRPAIGSAADHKLWVGLLARSARGDEAFLQELFATVSALDRVEALPDAIDLMDDVLSPPPVWSALGQNCLRGSLSFVRLWFT